MEFVLKRFTSSLLVISLLLLVSCSDTEVGDPQLIKEVEAIDKFLEQNTSDYIAADQSGIRIAISKFGQLPPVHKGQKIRATVRGKVLNGSGYFTELSFNSLLDSIGGEGLNYAISVLMVGSEATIYIPSKYAFGSNGTTNVPPNSTVVYEVTLNSITRTSLEQSQFVSDTTAIRRYIVENKISDLILHPSGIWYKITSQGTGEMPKVYDGINFNYKGTLLQSNTIFDEGSLNNTSAFGLIDGLKVGIPLMNKGAKAVFYIPSGLGYGTTGSGSRIPANANLIFDVDLTSINQ